MIVIGITGTLGAGKGTIVSYLQSRFGFLHFSVREFLSKEIALRNLPLNRDSMVIVANELRSKNGASYITDELYLKASLQSTNCIIESIRTPGEIYSLKRNGNFYLFAVDADSRLRYNRIKIRGSETDKVSFEVFLQNEEREYRTSDPNKQNLKKCIDLADYSFINNGSFEDLQKELDGVVGKILQ